MAVKRQIPLPSLVAVAAGVTATLDLPIGPRYHQVWLKISSSARQVFTDIVGEMRVKINGKVNRVFTAADLDALNSFMGSEYAKQTLAGTPDGIAHTELPLFFGEPWRKRIDIGAGLAWPSGGWATLQLEIDVKAGATNPAISGWAEVDSSVIVGADNTSGAPSDRLLLKWFKTALPVNGTQQDILSLPKRDAYTQISLFDNAIDSVRLNVEGVTIKELTKRQVDAFLRARGMVPVADRFDLVFDDDDSLDSALPMTINGQAVRDFQLRLNLSSGTARNIPCIYQVLGRPE